MQPTPNSQELAQIMRFVQSPAGQQLFASLQQLNSSEINSAMDKRFTINCQIIIH